MTTVIKVAPPPSYEESQKTDGEPAPELTASTTATVAEGVPGTLPVLAPPPPDNVPVHHSDADKIIEILLILFLPPLAVWYHSRACTGHVCLNICLCIFIWLPACIHALWYCYMRKP